jgi:hypothetical protein
MAGELEHEPVGSPHRLVGKVRLVGQEQHWQVQGYAGKGSLQIIMSFPYVVHAR